MGKISFSNIDGKSQVVEFTAGSTIMQVARSNLVNGIEAVCGGDCSCATCHVYVDENWLGKLPQMSAAENEMLEGTVSDRLPNSRLSCQINLAENLDGIVVTIPEFQS